MKFFFPGNARRAMELEALRRSYGPQKNRHAYYWVDDECNPWQFRNALNMKFDEQGKALVISIDQNWWFATWDNFLEDHGWDVMLNFWRSFWTGNRRARREAALRGNTATNWDEAMSIFQSARHDRRAREMTSNEEFIQMFDSEETASLVKERLGEWLYNVIRDERSGQLENLTKLVRGRSRPIGTEKVSEHEKVMREFSRFVTSSHRLPTKKELKEKVGNCDKRSFKALGLSGLPHA